MKVLSINYSILQNGLNKKFSSVLLCNSILTLSFLDVLFREGVIRNYKLSYDTDKIEVFLKYHKGVPVINKIKSISTSGRSIYYNLEDISWWKNNYSPTNSFLILNTSKQLFSSNELKDYIVGGHALCIVS
jgi:small subunit ribosomal protein S8